MDHIQIQEPDVDFTLLLGMDTFMDLSNYKWKRVEDIFKMIQGRIIVVYRPKEEENECENYHQKCKDWAEKGNMKVDN